MKSVELEKRDPLVEFDWRSSCVKVCAMSSSFLRFLPTSLPEQGFEAQWNGYAKKT